MAQQTWSYVPSKYNGKVRVKIHQLGIKQQDDVVLIRKHKMDSRSQIEKCHLSLFAI